MSLEESMAVIRQIEGIECGKEAAKHFAFDKSYRNLNHGELYLPYAVEREFWLLNHLAKVIDSFQALSARIQ